MKILVTGTAGFVGFHLAEKLIKRGDEVVGLDNLNEYYDKNLKFSRLAEHGIYKTAVEYNKIVRSATNKNYTFIQLNLEDKENMQHLFADQHFDVVVNLAAQAGVRYSLSNPQVYLDSNITGFTNLLECCRFHNIKHLVYASSSSVYGLNQSVPFSTSANVDHPISLYAATKKSNELMAHVYSYLFKIPSTGLRFFTVYGPWGRPDMALFLFTKAMIEGKPVQVFNNGEMQRDFTYIDDVIAGIERVIDNPPVASTVWDATMPDPSFSVAPYKLYNLGNSLPVKLTDFIDAIESELGVQAQREMMPLQPGDVTATYADVADLAADFDYKPQFKVAEGIKNFVKWYKEYYKIS